MGICNSCEATAVATLTAKLVVLDGKLQEFERPVKVSQVLRKEGPTCFVCNSDDMEFDGFVSAVNAEEELQLGQLYFLLPLSMLRKPLQAEEMAALAVKASAALMKAAAAGCRCRQGSVAPLTFPARSRDDVAGGGDGCRVVEVRKRRPKRGGGSGRNFTSELGSITE